MSLPTIPEYKFPLAPILFAGSKLLYPIHMHLKLNFPFLLIILSFCSPIYAQTEKAASTNPQQETYNAALTRNQADTLKRLRQSKVLAQNCLPKSKSDWTNAAEQSKLQNSSEDDTDTRLKVEYINQKTKGRILITIEANSPLIPHYGMMLANPASIPPQATTIESVNGHSCIVAHSTKNNYTGLKTIILGQFLITLDATNITKEELLAFAATMQFEALANP